MTITSADVKLDRMSLQCDGLAARIVLRHPPLNVIDIAMMEELSQVLTEIESRQDVSVILSGEGKAFSAGVDVAAHTPERVHDVDEV